MLNGNASNTGKKGKRWTSLSIPDLNAFIGLLLVVGLHRAHIAVAAILSVIISSNAFVFAENLPQQHRTIVGTLRYNKAEIPTERQPSNNRPDHSSLFGFADNLTITS